MAASTIPKSGGPGSPIELSPITIAVRDKVIEKFAGQPLDDMNSSLKAYYLQGKKYGYSLVYAEKAESIIDKGVKKWITFYSF